ncbi:MAG: type II secretion system protein, partial [Sulfolobaceae archaeon]
FTLIETIISLLILCIVMLGMLYTVNLAINTNMQNNLRDEAIKIAQGEVNTILNNANNSTGALQSYTKTVNVSINNFQETYNVSVNAQQESNNGMNNVIIYTVTVTWNYKGQPQVHTETTAVHL